MNRLRRIDRGGPRSGPQPPLPAGWGGAGTFLACLGLALVLLGCSPPSKPDPTDPLPPESSRAPWFRDVTAETGLRFQHQTGQQERYFMPEQMGSGAAFFDYDQDGRLDVFLVQCGGPGSGAHHQLLHQNPNGSFTDVTRGSGLDVDGHGMGVTVGDVDNDGNPDLLLTEYGGVRLFLNRGGGRFTEVTTTSGLVNPRWATSAAFLDYDRDGWLDLVVANYLDYNPTQQCFDARGRPEYCGPHGFPGLVTRLFRNQGASASANPAAERFEDVTVTAGLAATPGPALGVVCLDFDGDTWPDIFLADDGRPNRLFINRRDGTFAEEAAVRGLAFTAMGQTAGDMGVAVGDTDGDGMFDLFVTHLAEEQHSLWRQGPRGLFQDQFTQSLLPAQKWRGTGFGAVLADFDRDGFPDLAMVNGRVKRGDPGGAVDDAVQPFWHPYAQRSQLFANNGRGGFEDMAAANPDWCGRAMVGRGLVWGDVDNDGDVDLLATGTGGPARLYRNVAPESGNWLSLRLVLPQCGGRDAYGAEIRFQTDERAWWGAVQPASSYLSSHDPRILLGLGRNTGPGVLHVFWPDGKRERFRIDEVNRPHVVAQGHGQADQEGGGG